MKTEHIVEHIVIRNTEIVCLHCGEEKTIFPLMLSQAEAACELFVEEHKNCKKERQK